MFNDQPWLCHRHIAPDVTQCSTWYQSPQFPVSIFDFVTDISLLILLNALPMGSRPKVPPSSPWVDVQWSTLALSPTYRAWCYTVLYLVPIPPPIPREHLWLCHWYILPDAAQSPTNPSSHKGEHKPPQRSGSVSLWANVQLPSMTLSLIYRTWCCSKRCSKLYYSFVF